MGNVQRCMLGIQVATCSRIYAPWAAAWEMEWLGTCALICAEHWARTSNLLSLHPCLEGHDFPRCCLPSDGSCEAVMQAWLPVRPLVHTAAWHLPVKSNFVLKLFRWPFPLWTCCCKPKLFSLLLTTWQPSFPPMGRAWAAHQGCRSPLRSKQIPLCRKVGKTCVFLIISSLRTLELSEQSKVSANSIIQMLFPAFPFIALNQIPASDTRGKYR